MNLRKTILLAFAAAACTTNGQNASLLITKVVAPAATTSPTGGSTCTVDQGGTESSFLRINPAENVGAVGVVVQNTIQPTTIVNPILRTDASMFLPHQAVIDYEVLTTGASTSLPEKIVPATGGVVPGQTSAAISVIMFPPGVLSPTLAAGTYIRATFHIEGTLASGSTVKTSQHEYLFQICTTAGCAGNTCL